MSETLLTVKNLHARVGDEEILKGIDLDINPGEIHVLMGPNGAGKSTLGNSIMGNPVYEVTEGDILFKGESIKEEAADKRAARGIFMSFQNPLEVPGLSLEDFMRSAIRAKTGQPVKIFKFRRELEEQMKLLEMDESYSARDLNVGFSGGEKKKAEILQMLMLKPELVILDETDSGLDVDAVKTVTKGVKEYSSDKSRSFIIITHSTRILEGLNIDKVHVLVKGKIVKTGDASLIDSINSEGFEAFTASEE